MDIKGKVAVVTGGANGIGEALAAAFMEAGAKSVAIVDQEYERALEVAKNIGGKAYAVNVADEEAVRDMIIDVEQNLGPIELYCSNAGVGYSDAPGWTSASASNDKWQKSWEVNVFAHVLAARVLIPLMQKRGQGYFLITSSAAGLLSQIGDAAYSTTKHAAIGFAESLAITHGNDGIKVSVLCPQAVDTRMIKGIEAGAQTVDGIMPRETLAAEVMKGLKEEKFLILPHKTVTTYMERKVADYDRWLKGMRKLRDMIIAEKGTPL